jgi:UDP-N-acetylglucosamine--N-acetylmuramyl-(pentapeptide) pyrophosphoryl-undecaprenol N-acetylglucosamine transferase
VHDERTVVFFAGGGTGGHLYPALALAEALVALRPDVRPVFLGARRGIEARVLPARGVEHLLLPVRGFARGAGARAQLAVLPALARALATAAGAVRDLRPELVVVTGGYAGAPAGLLATAMRVPLAVQEQNSVPGLVTRWLSLGARQVHVAFPEAVGRLPSPARSRARVSGNPVRPPVARDPARARLELGLEPYAPVVLVVGGSQGSAALNRVTLEMVEALAGSGDPGFQLLWSTGPAHEGAVTGALARSGFPGWVRAVGYLDDMPAALACAALAVSRAGAMATSEFLAWGLPSILVPLPTAAADHQTQNARALATAGAALQLPEAGLAGDTLLEAVRALVDDPPRREAMARAARARGRPRAAEQIARELAGLLRPPPLAGGTGRRAGV